VSKIGQKSVMYYLNGPSYIFCLASDHAQRELLLQMSEAAASIHPRHDGCKRSGDYIPSISFYGLSTKNLDSFKIFILVNCLT